MVEFPPKHILKGLHRFEDTAVSLLLFSMIILSCLQIGLRTIFSSGIVWADPLLRYIVLWTGLFGAAIATRNNRHIAIDLITHLVSDQISKWLGVIIELFSLVICIMLTYASIIFVVNEASFGNNQTILGFSSWQLNLIFPISFGLISFHFLVCAISVAREAISGKTR